MFKDTQTDTQTDRHTDSKLENSIILMLNCKYILIKGSRYNCESYLISDAPQAFFTDFVGIHVKINYLLYFLDRVYLIFEGQGPILFLMIDYVSEHKNRKI